MELYAARFVYPCINWWLFWLLCVMNSDVTFPCRCLSVFSLLLGVPLGVGLLGHMEAHHFGDQPDCFVPFSFLTIRFLFKVFFPHVAYDKTRHREAINLHPGPAWGGAWGGAAAAALQACAG